MQPVSKIAQQVFLFETRLTDCGLHTHCDMQNSEKCPLPLFPTLGMYYDAIVDKRGN